MSTVALTWRKSSHSGGAGGNGNGGDCVEVAYLPGGALVRDSKTGGTGAVLRTSRRAFAALLTTATRDH